MPVGKVNRQKVQKEAAQERELRAGGNTFFKLKDGKNKIRILPPPPGSEDFYFKTATSWGVGPNSVNLNLPVDEKGRVGGWLQEKIWELSKSGRSEDKKLAEKIRPKKQWLYNIVDLNDIEAGMQVMAVGIKCHEQILAYFEDEEDDDDYADITDLDEGYNLSITKTGEGRNTDYKVKAARNPSAIPDEIRELLETENPADLSTVRPIADDDEQKAAFYGEDDSAEEEEDDEEETPVVRKRKKAPVVKKQAKPEPEEEEEEEEDSDDDEFEEDSDDDDDDDDEGDDDDDDADEAPPVKKSFGSKIRAKAKSRSVTKKTAKTTKKR